jgi:antitoxin ParD1/3/4
MSKLRYSREQAMNVSLTPLLEKMIRDKVESGMYNNASVVVREALRLMAEAEKQKREAFLKSLDDAWKQHLRGESVPIEELTLERIRAEAAEMELQGLPIEDDVKW